MLVRDEAQLDRALGGTPAVQHSELLGDVLDMELGGALANV
jgi:hypothetical protein